MPTRIQQRSRTATNNTATSKTPVSILKQNVSQTNSNIDTGIISSNTYNEPMRSKQLNIITEVDETNIEEVVHGNNISNIPKTFINEIKKDPVYETIAHELETKLPTQTPQRLSLAVSNISDFERENLSPSFSDEFDDDSDMDYDDNRTIDESCLTNANTYDASKPKDEYDTDIEGDDMPVGKRMKSYQEKYLDLCINSNLIPCSYFTAHIEEKEMILRYHQFRTKDIQLIAKSLSSNSRIERLVLDGNSLQQQSAKYISTMILKNDFITELSLADNYLGGGEGTKHICRMIMLSRHLKKINLSGNKFSELDAQDLIDAFDQNRALREVDLSHNCLGERCGKILGAFISGNDSLESIDLSWNNIRGRNAVDVAIGLKENVRLKRCNLEMNGFGPDGGLALADCIKDNGALEELNINKNRLNTPTAFAIADAILKNDCLKVLKIAQNQINSDGVLAIFLAIKISESSILEEIDFSHTVVTEETHDICNEISKIKHGNFQYQIGDITPNMLKPNSSSIYYTKTNDEILNSLRSSANKNKDPEEMYL